MNLALLCYNFSIKCLLQSVKTRVIKNNLNPVWNESLMLSIPEHIPPLKVVSYVLYESEEHKVNASLLI